MKLEGTTADEVHPSISCPEINWNCIHSCCAFAHHRLKQLLLVRGAFSEVRSRSHIGILAISDNHEISPGSGMVKNTQTTVTIPDRFLRPFRMLTKHPSGRCSAKRVFRTPFFAIVSLFLFVASNAWAAFKPPTNLT